MSTYPYFPDELKRLVSYGPYRAIVEKYRDADTVELLVEGPFHSRVSAPVRIAGIDAPELRTAEGEAALRFAAELMPVGSYCLLDTRFRQSFDRWIGSITLPSGQDYGTALMEAGRATAYPP